LDEEGRGRKEGERGRRKKEGEGGEGGRRREDLNYSNNDRSLHLQ
jgi:hypothetical protein